MYKSDNVGSFIRIPNEDGRWLFLMKIPMDWHEEDLKAAQEVVDQKEETIRSTDIEGSYGEVKLNFGR